ncbi:MAG: DJ-1/PfpI family protein, partial [Actinomycetota bacterium]
MPSVVIVIAPTVFRDEEYAEPKAILEAHGAQVTTASVAPGECLGKLGMRAVATVSVSEAASRQWDGVVFVGGAGARVFFDDPDAHELAHHQLDRDAVLAAICI